PTSISLSVTTIPESDTVNQVISSISCIDPDVADTHVYTLVSGTGSVDNGKVKINGSSLILNAALNYYIQDSLQIRIRSTDNRGCFYEQAFVIHLTHVNHTPYAIQINDSSIFDHQAVHTLVGLLSASDPDQNEIFTYVLTPGVGDTNNVSFSISHDSLYAEASFDSLVKHRYSIRVRVNDHAMAHFERAMTIRIKDSNDPPIAMALSSIRIYENLPPRSFIAKMSTTDDIGHSFVYTFSNTGTNDNNSFTISNDSLLSNVMFDFETRNLYNIILTTTDSIGLSYTKPFSIHIRDTLDSPTDIMISNAFVLENRPVHTFIGVFSTADVNGPNAQHTYSLVSGAGSTDNTSFTISADTLYSNARYDYEVKKLLSLRVRTTLANNLFLDKPFAINVTEGADTITDIRISNDSLYENSSPTTIIGQLSTVSQDTSDRYTYAFDNSVPNNNSVFSLTSTGLLSAAQSFDYDIKSSYVISVTSKNIGGTSFIKQLTIKIRDTLDTPTDIHLSDSLIADNKPAHTFIGKFSTTDENGPLASHTYSLVTGTNSADDSSFVIGHDSLFAKSMADFEAQPFYHVRIRSTLINGMYVEKPFMVYVTSTGEKPVAHNDSIAVPEDSKPSYLITATASDTDSHATFTFILLNRNVPFALDSVTGDLSLTGPLNFHQASRYLLTFMVKDDNHPARTDTAHIIVTVLAVQEAVLPINNYVSPNGDGKNDKLVITSVEVYTDYELTIYNTSGMVVYQTKTYDNSWDGQGLDAGVYYYTFYGQKKYKGSITLVK
ncbi:MAG TPA: cadherin domain-containing protein, partial [Bacteroidia bacterium]|nr:cadherin domain-containing protein [Bacteroidia bacterium]